MKLGELAARDVADQMKRQGVDLDTGPFVVRLETPIADLVDEIRSLYHDFPAGAGGGFADFHVAVRRPAGLFGARRWLRQQAIAYLDEIRPFEPLPIHMAVPMLEWSMNWCVANQANQYVMIHAAVLERQGSALHQHAGPQHQQGHDRPRTATQRECASCRRSGHSGLDRVPHLREGRGGATDPAAQGSSFLPARRLLLQLPSTRNSGVPDAVAYD